MKNDSTSKNSTINPALAERLGIGIFKYQLSPVKQFVDTNIALAKIFGCSSRQALEKLKFPQLLHNPHDRERFFALLQEKGKVEFFETTGTSKHGKEAWIAISAGLTKNGGREKYVEGIVQNISPVMELQNKLSSEIDALQGLIDNMPDAIYFKDRKNRIIKVNKFYAKGFRLPPEKIIGKTDFDFFPEEQARQMFADDDSVLKTGKPIIGKIERTLLPNKTWNQVITTKIPMVDRKGRIIGTMGITRDMTAHANLERERYGMVLNAFQVLGKALEMRDPYTYSHTCHVAKIAQSIAQAMGYDEDRIMQIKLAAELHDLGKISIPLDLLIKPGQLTELEFSVLRQHVANCHSLIKGIEFPFPLAEIIYQHHERLDGSGYPRQLKGKSILMEARILAVSDVLESMTSHRPYREALGIQIALQELIDGSGTKYDPRIVKTVLELVDESSGKPFWKNNAA
jgi:PAS domain S-box-containing protein